MSIVRGPGARGYAAGPDRSQAAAQTRSGSQVKKLTGPRKVDSSLLILEPDKAQARQPEEHRMRPAGVSFRAPPAASPPPQPGLWEKFVKRVDEIVNIYRATGPSSATPPHGPVYGPHNFMLGANLPWVAYGGDFGANAWQPQGGITRPEQREKLNRTFALLAQQGVRNVRWFMLCDGRAGIRFDAQGTPVGLDEHFFGDVDAALEVARKHGIKIVFTLLDFGWLGKPEMVNGVQVRGHADVVRDPAKRQALLDNVFKPIFQRYGRDPNIQAWDIINEPEWATFGVGTLNPFKRAYSSSPSQMRAFIGQAVDYVHRYTDQQATVGSASTFWLGLVKGLGLDFYQAHWYDWLELVAPLDKPADKLKLDRPVILGEFPTKDTRKSARTVLDTVQQAGYGGAMPWAVLSDDEKSGYDAIGPILADWAREHAADLNK